MTTFLNWKNYESRSRERLITDLFSYLSPRWYPVNVIGTDTYYIFKMYTDQLSSASLESQQIFEDLFIKSVTSNPSTGRSVSKMYDNFGSLFEVNKLFEQDYEEYNQAYYLQSYRQQLRFLSEAYFNDPVIKSIKLVGQSYNGISPVMEESCRDVLGWKLQTVTGSILSVGDDVVVLDKIIPRIGNIYPLATSSVVGDTFTYTFSKLGVNTKLIGTKRYNSGVDLYIFASGGGSNSFQSSIENSIDNVLKSDIISRYYYSDTFVIWKPSTSSLPLSTNVFSYASGGYIYNNTYVNSINEIYLDLVPGSEITGEITPFYKWSITSDVIGLPTNYNNYTWYYDWSVLTRNETSYKVYLRSYPQEDIPDTVYFKEYRSELNSGLLLSQINPSGSLQGTGHWLFTTLSRANDITGYTNDLTQISGSITSQYILPREQTKLGWKLQTGSINLAKTVYNNDLDLYNKNFLWEGWIYGIDSNFYQPDNFFIFKREIPSTGSIEDPVSGSIISFGTPTVLTNMITIEISSFIYDANHFIACFHNSFGDAGVAFIGTISGTNISVSPYYTFATGAVNYVSATLLDSTHFIVNYKEPSLNYGISKIGTISGSVLTFGSPYTFNADFTGFISTDKIDDNNFLNLYADGNSHQNGVAIIGTVSGSTISFGTPYEFSTDGVTDLQGKVINSSNFIMTYTDIIDDHNGKVRIGTISGSVITFGSSSTIDCNSYFYNPSIVLLDNTNFVISYEDLLINAATGAIVKGIISGSTALLESSYVYSPYSVHHTYGKKLSSTKFLINYADSNQGYAGVSSVMEISGSVVTHNPLFNYTYSVNPVQATDASVFDAITYVITYCLSDTTGISVLATINEGNITPSSSAPSTFGNYLFNDGYAFIINSNDTSFKLQIKNGGTSGSISGSILNYLSEAPYRPHYFSCLNVYDNIYLNIDNKTIATGTLGIHLPLIPSVSTGAIQIQSNAINLGIDEIYLSTGSIIPGYVRTRFTESSPKVYSRKLFEPDQYHQIQTQVYGAGANEFEFHQFSLRGIETPFSTSSVLLPLFSIGSGSEMLGYKGNFIEDYGYHI